jgi:hypothetical protein
MNYAPKKIRGVFEWLRQTAWPWVRVHARQINRIISFILLMAVLASIGYQILANWQQVRSYSWKWDVKFLLLGFGVYSVSLLLTASIWALIICRLSGIQSLLTHIGLYSLTNLAQRLPTPIPYISVRTEAYARRGVPRATTLTAMSLEVIVTVAGALVVAVATLPFGFQENLRRYDAPIWLLLIPLLVFVIRPDWFFAALNRMFLLLKRSPIQVRVKTLDILTWVSLFAAVWLNGGVLYYFLANSIYPVAPDKLLAIVNVFAVSGIVGWVGQFLFFIPNLAARQVAAAYLLGFFMPLPVAIAVALLTRLCIMAFELVWALVFSIVLKIVKIPM